MGLLATHPVTMRIACVDWGRGRGLRLRSDGFRVVTNGDALASVGVDTHSGDAHKLALALASLLIDTKAWGWALIDSQRAPGWIDMFDRLRGRCRFVVTRFESFDY